MIRLDLIRIMNTSHETPFSGVSGSFFGLVLGVRRSVYFSLQRYLVFIVSPLRSFLVC